MLSRGSFPLSRPTSSGASVSRRALQDPCQQLRGTLLAVLATFAQLQLQTGRHGREAVDAFVGGERHAFLLGLGVVHGGDVGIQRHQAVGQRGNRRLAAAQERDGRFDRDVLEARRVGVQALAQGRRQGGPIQPQGFEEVGIAAEGVDGLEVALAQTPQRHVAGEDVPMRDGVAPCGRRRGGIRDQVGALADRHPDQSQSRVGGKIRLGYRNDQPPRRVTCRVSPNDAPL